VASNIDWEHVSDEDLEFRLIKFLEVSALLTEDQYKLFFEKVYQALFPFITLGPSVFLKARQMGGKKQDQERPTGEMEISSSAGGIIHFVDILICPGCGSKGLELKTEELTCKDCGRSYGHQKSIIDFRL
jgi:hypothetical protein